MSVQLPPRKIGSDLVSPIGYGAMSMGGLSYGPAESDEERFKLLDAVYEAGYTHWDTANVYKDSEDILGKWFKRTGKRSEIFLATKFGVTPDGPRGDPAYVRESIEKSLARLGVDYVDLYYLHRPDGNVPIERTVGAMAELVKEGKVKYLGLSECCAEDVRRACKVHPVAALQVEYSPFHLEIETEKVGLMDVCKELGITVVAYSPLGKGLLTGQFKSPDDFAEGDIRHTIPKYSKENFPNILAVVDKLTDIGKKHNATSGQIALAWLLAQGDHVSVVEVTVPLLPNRNVTAGNAFLGV